MRRENDVAGHSVARQKLCILKTLPGRLETERCAFYLAKEGQFPSEHSWDFLWSMPLGWHRRWRDDGFRLRRSRDDRPRDDRCVCVSLRFGGTLVSFGRASFSLVYLFGAAFGGAAVG